MFDKGKLFIGSFGGNGEVIASWATTAFFCSKWWIGKDYIGFA